LSSGQQGDAHNKNGNGMCQFNPFVAQSFGELSSNVPSAEKEDNSLKRVQGQNEDFNRIEPEAHQVNFMPNFSNFDDANDNNFDCGDMNNDMWDSIGQEPTSFDQNFLSKNNTKPFDLNFSNKENNPKDQNVNTGSSEYNPANFINKLDFESIMNQTYQEISGSNLQF